jgi:putative membrane protein
MVVLPPGNVYGSRMEHPREQVHPVPEERPGAVYGYGPYPLLAIRSVVGGIFLGLGTVVHGLGGGIMLVAAGIYPYLVQSVADVTRLRLDRRALLVLSLVFGCAGISIVVLGGFAQAVAAEMRWAVYSLDIGILLGGLFLNYSMLRPPNLASGLAFIVGVGITIGLHRAQLGEPRAPVDPSFALLVAGGFFAATAVVLPMVSGGYLLGLIGAHDAVRDAVAALRGDGALAIGDALATLLPFLLGWILGIVAISNVAKAILVRYEKVVLGLLLGFLAGSLNGLWPFRRLVPFRAGEVLDGRVLTAFEASRIPSFRFRVEGYDPTTPEAVMAAVIVLSGFLLMALLAKFGNQGESGLAAAARQRMSLPDRPTGGSGDGV